MPSTLRVKTVQEDAEFKLGLRVAAGAEGLDRVVEHPRIQKPGLAIAGLVEALRPGRIQVLGSTEQRYLAGLSAAAQGAALAGLVVAQAPCIVVTADAKVPAALAALAAEHALAVLVTPLPSTTFIARCHAFLDEHLSPQITLHGVLVDVFAVGVLLVGPSGIGKSECALDLVLRGHRLVADDTVVARQRDRELVGSSPTATHNHMEVRGLGIINVKDLFGAASVASRKRVDLVVEMREYQANAPYDRLGLDDATEAILGVAVPKLTLPIRPGRNVASIVEVAARNHLLKGQGRHSARRFEQSLERRMAPGPRGRAGEGK